jgi:ribosomal protein S18 acetylase RimI-like enzyme
MAPVHLRLATPTDADSISALAIATFALGCPPGTDPRDIELHASRELTSDRFHSFIADPAVTLVLAEAGDALAGYTMLVRNTRHALLAPADAGSAAELRKFYVDPRFHGLGVAQALMHRALDLIDSEAGVIWLSVNASNPRAQAFYRKFGFEVIGTQQFLVGNDLQDDLIMRRRNEGASL